MSFFKNGNLIEQATTTATAGGTTTLTVSSKSIQNFSGSSNQTVKLPVATTLANGQKYEILNSSTGILTIQYQDTSNFSTATVSPNTSLTVRLMDNSTANGVWGVAASSGKGTGGGKNYLTTYLNNPGNGDFELGSTSGWSLGTTGTLTNGLPTGTPTFGSGASGNLSISAVTSGKLAGTYSLSYASSAATVAGDMLASDTFNIDSSDQAKVLAFKLNYQAFTNPSNGNFSGTSSNSFAVGVYDVTNSAWIPVTGAFGMTQSFGIGIATGTFQTASNTTQLRFVMYNSNASAGAITMYFDDFSVGPQTTNIGPVVTDWQSYAPTISGLGTATGVSFFYKRVGDSLEIMGSLIAGTATGSNVSFSLPSGMSIDTSKTATPIRVGDVSVATSSVYGALADTSSSTTLIYVFNNNIDTKLTGTNWGSSNKGGINAIIPIQGWSSNVQMSNDTDTRVVAMAAFKSTTQSISNSTDTTVTSFNTVAVDTHAAFNASTGTYTVPVSGNYKVDMTTHFASNATGYRVTQILKNGAVYQYGNIIPAVSGDGTATMASAIISCVAGDTIAQRVYQTSGGALDIRALSNATSIHINRLSGPSVIAASETVACDYNTAAGQSIPNNTETILDFGTKVYDTHGAVTTGASWKFTALVSGLYSVQAFGTWAAASWTVNQITRISLYKNGALYRRLASQQAGNTLSHQLNPCAGSTTLQMNAGDYIYITAYQNQGGAVSMLASADSVYVSITRVGN